MSEWVAWIEPTDDDEYPYEPPRRYVKRLATAELTKSRGLAARYPTEDDAESAAREMAGPRTPFGTEEVRASGRGLKS